MNRFAVFVKCGCMFPRRRGVPARAEQLPRFESLVRIAGESIANARKSWYTMEAIAMQMSQLFTTEDNDLCGEPIAKGEP
jgi:hypothetical protein